MFYDSFDKKSTANLLGRSEMLDTHTRISINSNSVFKNQRLSQLANEF